MKSKIFSTIILVSLLIGCNKPTSTETIPTNTVPPTVTLGDPQIQTTSVPDPTPVAQAYLTAWENEDYTAMYQMLTEVSRGAITEEDFTQRFVDLAANAALTHWETDILASLVKSPYAAEISYQVILHSALVDDVVRDTVMGMVLENGQWRIQWDDALILPELTGGNTLRIEIEAPARANIYDRDGHALVAQADAVAIGLAAGEVAEEPGELYTLLQRVTGISASEIQADVDANRANNWYVPVADVAADEVEPFLGALSSYSGIRLTPFSSRYYFGEGIAPHVVGYMSAIQADEVEKYKRLGYAWNERVGRMGLEIWGEPYLGGTRGGKLYVVSPDGAIVTLLSDRAPAPSQAIYTTIDKDLQKAAQVALTGLNGAIVIMEVDTGRVIAMASSPEFNPNLFEPTNANSGVGLSELPYSFELNRASQGTYPLGSVFKIITMAAGLETGKYPPETVYNCTYDFTELQGVVLHDWTWEHYQEDGRTQASGELNLLEGLMRSCNPWFYHIGLGLFNQGLPNAVSDMAVGFGLGSDTGIEIAEQPGNVPVPQEQQDATNNAIGQGNTQVTPLQVADFMAAIANGGTLYRPTVIDKIVPPYGDPTYTFTSTVRGTLPISPENLQLIRDGLTMVVDNPRGTAYRPVGVWLRGYNLSAVGKTGTAQSGGGEPHAWFAGYTTENREDKPDIAIAIVLEYQGEGSEWAAPIFSRMVYSYFNPGGVRPPLPWEVQPGVWKTETPEVTETPEPEATVEPNP